MPCDTSYRQLARENETRKRKEAERAKALKALESKIRMGTVKVEKNFLTGGLKLVGWGQDERAGLHDLCALDALASQNSEALNERLRALGVTREQVAVMHGH